jgi:tetratricopeptide (TPR) repeat protein
MRRSLSLLAAALIASARIAAAQMEHAHAGHDTGHVGRVRFATSCTAAVQPVFERGVALLHSFWYEEATATFREAAAQDTACAMAQWGVAMSYLHPLWAAPPPADLRAGTDAVARGRALHAPTERERAWVEAIGAYYDSAESAPHGARLMAWERAMARVQQAFAADTEAAIFHALALIAVQPKTDTSYARLRQAAAILEPLFARKPSHPGLAHYLIHAYDAPPLVGRAVRAASRYAAIAPSVPHAQHMPSHSYSLLGMWDQSIAANRRSIDAARRFEVEQHMDGAWDQRLHATDYMVYAYLQEGRDASALALVREAAGVERTVPPGGATAEFALAATPARYALERDDWRAAAALTPRSGVTIPLVRAVTAFARGLGAARAGDTAAARAELAAFPELVSAAATGSDPFAPAMIRINQLAASAWLLLATGDTAGAVRAATQAADVEDGALKNPLTPGPLLSARELLGDLLLETGRPAEAVTAYRAALANTPRRARSLAGGVRAAARAGDMTAARAWRRQLLALLAQGDPERRVALGAMH